MLCSRSSYRVDIDSVQEGHRVPIDGRPGDHRQRAASLPGDRPPQPTPPPGTFYSGDIADSGPGIFVHGYDYEPMMHGAEFTADQITQTSTSVNNTKTSDASKKRRSESTVWEEFTKVSNGQQAECKHCLKRLSGKSTGGTSHLSRHLKICPERSGNTSKQPHCSPPQALEQLSRPTISNLCPFPIMGSAGFRQVLAGMYHPTSNMIPRIVTEEQFITMFQSERRKLKEKIASVPGGVFLSVGRWVLEQKVFICLAVHFIDDKWKINRRIIRCFCSGIADDDPEHYINILPNWQKFTYLSTDFNGVPNETVSEYSLEDKLLGVALSESVDYQIILDLQKILTRQNYLLAECKLITIPCSVHALHQLFISAPNYIILETSKKLFNYMTCSPLRKKKYQQVLSQMCLHRPSFHSEKWYSTFYLMEAWLLFHKAFPNPEQMDSVFYPFKPSCEALEEAESFCRVARPIYHAIRVLTISHVTLSSYFHALWSVRTALHESSGKIFLERVLNIKGMLKSFDKHWRNVYLWLSVAVVLDPRYKMRFLEHCFRQACGSGARMYISEVQGKIYGLFFQYSSRAHRSRRTNHMQMNTHRTDPLDDGRSQNYNEQTAHEALKELHLYLDGDLCAPNDVNYLSREALPQDVNFDILKWWKDNASIYPVLAALTRDVLAIPGCAVSAESAFDETDERVHLFTRKLSHEMVEAVICTQDWFQDSETSDANGGNCSLPI